MSGLIPQPFIDELLSRTDLVELIDGYIPLKKRGTSFIACCPFHNEKTPSFNVVAKKQFYHCFGCGVSGNAISFTMSYLNQGFTQAIETLASRIGLEVPRDSSAEKNQQSLNLYQLLAKISTFYQQNLKTNGQVAIDYLRKRGLNGETAKRYQLGYASSGWQTLETQFKQLSNELIATGMIIQNESKKTYDRYRHRIMFPIHDRHGRIVGFGGRAIDGEQKPKYLNSPETVLFQKSRELYGLHQILQRKQPIDQVVIVEGYMDVIALAQHGIPHAVATLGTATSIYHIQLLAKYTKTLIFCFDGDTAGRGAAWRALENCLPALNEGLDVGFIFLPEGHDPDSLVREEGASKFMERLANKTPLSRYFLDTVSQGIDTFSIAGRTLLVKAAKPYLLKMQDGPYKQLLLNELARMTHIENYRLVQLLNQETGESQEMLPPKKINNTPIRLAIALILQNPEIFSTCKEAIGREPLDGPGQTLLSQVLEQIEQSPGANTAMLIEAWRETPYFEALSKLAGWDHQEPEAELAQKFTDIILFLQKQNLENKINHYLAKSSNQGLTVSEQRLLQEMIRKNRTVVKQKN
ncbi:MAG: DNA primase [Tatlockia sp.]|jgi:DNA primase